MSNRFVDNETPLNAETLNAFEDDLRAASTIPVYNAVLENESDGYKNYRISDVNWESIPLNSYFSVKLSHSTQGSSNNWVALKFGASNSSGVICYNNLDTPGLNNLMRVDSRKYLYANVPYLIKKNNTQLFNIGLIIAEWYDTSKMGSALGISGNMIQLKNMDGTAISSVNLPAAEQTVRGGVKIWLSGSTLNISTD